MKRRILFSDNGTLDDMTNNLHDFYANTETFTVVADDDSILIGATLPFNHFYIDATGTNSNTSTMAIQYWDGTEWEDVVEVDDGTSLAGATIGQSGFVEFVTDKKEGWGRDDTVNSNGVNEVTGFGTNVIIYDLFWLKVTFSADLTETIVNWIGSKYSNDNDLKGEFADLSRSAVMTAIESGKTDWEDQHRIAAKIIEKDLIRNNIIVNENQILSRDDLTLASVQKVASLIYNQLGDDYVDQFAAAEKEYLKRLKNAYVKVDTNSNARIDTKEQRPTIGHLFR